MSDQIAYFIQANTFLIVLWLGVEFGFKKSENYRFIRFYLIAGILLSLLLPFLKFSSFNELNNTALVSSALSEVSVLSEENHKQTVFNWLTILISIYLIGALFQLIRFVQSLIKIKLLYNLSKPVNNYREVQDSSVAFSFFKTVFLGSNLSDKDKEMTLKHELIHTQKLHSIDLIICEILLIVFWYNPFIYKIKDQFVIQHEFEADDLSCTENYSYIELLLQQNFNAYELSFIHQFNTNHLKSRIMRLTTNSTNKINKWAITISIMAFGVIFLSNCTVEDAESDHPEATKTSLENSAMDIVKQPEQAAEFPGGQEALYSFIVDNISYPVKAKQDNVEGTVYTQFIIDSKGDVKDIKVVRGVSQELDQAAVDVLKALPQWKPAENNGKKVNTLFTIPIKYQLPKKEK